MCYVKYALLTTAEVLTFVTSFVKVVTVGCVSSVRYVLSVGLEDAIELAPYLVHTIATHFLYIKEIKLKVTYMENQSHFSHLYFRSLNSIAGTLQHCSSEHDVNIPELVKRFSK